MTKEIFLLKQYSLPDLLTRQASRDADVSVLKIPRHICIITITCIIFLIISGIFWTIGTLDELEMNSKEREYEEYMIYEGNPEIFSLNTKRFLRKTLFI